MICEKDTTLSEKSGQ
uniref:Uncharacterized protein n=1 Tax=Arundo donax TaxID=35708 RepID=A0A0A9FWM6_ARUDO